MLGKLNPGRGPGFVPPLPLPVYREVETKWRTRKEFPSHHLEGLYAFLSRLSHKKVVYLRSVLGAKAKLYTAGLDSWQLQSRVASGLALRDTFVGHRPVLEPNEMKWL